MPDRTVFNFLDLSVGRIAHHIELIRNIAIIVNVETVEHDSLNPAAPIRPEHDHHNAVLRALGRLCLPVADLQVELVVQHVVEEERELVLAAVVPVDYGEVTEVEDGQEELLEVVFNSA